MTENKDIEIAEKIDKWFETFENGLKEIFKKYHKNNFFPQIQP